MKMTRSTISLFTGLRRLHSTIKSPKITHVIFDFDGVLLNTEKIFYQANAACLEKFGSRQKYNNELKQGQMGRRLEEGVEWLLKETGLLAHGVTPSSYTELWRKLV